MCSRKYIFNFKKKKEKYESKNAKEPQGEKMISPGKRIKKINLRLFSPPSFPETRLSLILA